METIKDNNKVLLHLSNDEAIILLNWLYRFNVSDNDTFFEDQSEQRVLWDMEAVLEKNIDEIFGNDYTDALLKARQEVRDKE